MTAMQLLEATGEVRNQYIQDLWEAKPTRGFRYRALRWSAAAAACLILALGTVLFLNTRETSQLFAITAYAHGADGEEARGETMKESEKIPVDAFRLEDGKLFFAFSYLAPDPNDPIHVIIRGSETAQYPAVKLAAGISEYPGNVYVYYVPDLLSQEPPYIVDIITESALSSRKYTKILITLEDDGQYYASMEEAEMPELISVKVGGDSQEQREIPDWLREWYEPYQAALDKINEEVGYTIIVLPEENLWNFYEVYQNKTPQEFEEEARNDLKDAGVLD